MPMEMQLSELERVVRQGGPSDDGNAFSTHLVVVEGEFDGVTVVNDRKSVTRDALVVILERDGQRFIILDFRCVNINRRLRPAGALFVNLWPVALT